MAARVARQIVDLAARPFDPGAADIGDLQRGDDQRIVAISRIDLDSLDGEILEDERIGLDVQAVAIGKRPGIGQVAPDQEFAQRLELDEIDARGVEVGVEVAAMVLRPFRPAEAAGDRGVVDPRGDVIE